jgi:hypothetical protein
MTNAIRLLQWVAVCLTILSAIMVCTAIAFVVLEAWSFRG